MVIDYMVIVVMNMPNMDSTPHFSLVQDRAIGQVQNKPISNILLAVK